MKPHKDLAGRCEGNPREVRARQRGAKARRREEGAATGRQTPAKTSANKE